MKWVRPVLLLGSLLSSSVVFASPLYSTLSESDFHMQTGSYLGLNSTGKECKVTFSSDERVFSISVHPSITTGQKKGDRGAHAVFIKSVPVYHSVQIEQGLSASTLKVGSEQFMTHLYLAQISGSKIRIQIHNDVSTYADCDFSIPSEGL